MLMGRLFEPEGDQLLYHYCSAESFQAIFESGKLRFTDINMLNDSTEHRWGYAVFEEAATRLIKRIGVNEQVPIMPIEFFDAIDSVLSKGQLIAHPFIACLSLDGNSLDQWRKYGDDGRGYAIGFLATGLQSLPISLLQVSYDKEEQVREMMAALLAIHSRTPKPEMPLSGVAFEDAALLSTLMASLKHPSFASEREVRCVRAISLEPVGQNRRFVDRGGQTREGSIIPGEPVRFANRGGSLTAYVDIPYALETKSCAITEVAVGPRNGSGPGNLFLFLGGLGHSEINVRPSSLPYR